MIKLTWGNLRDREFLTALGKLFAQPMGFDLSRDFVLIGKEIKVQQKMMDETHEKMLKKYGVADTERKGFYNIPEGANREEYAEEIKKLEANTFKIRIKRFDPEEIAKLIQLSPQDFLFLEPLLLPIELPAEVEESTNQPVEEQKAQPEPATH